MLKSTEQPLWAAYDLAMLDLDGVVYVGRAAVPGVAEQLGRAREAGMHLAFVTNNASRPPAVVADHLVELGVKAAPADVVTSAQAAAHLLAVRLDPGAPVFLLGGHGLDEALRAEGLRPVTTLADEPAAVVSGYGPDVPWNRLMQGAVLIRDGLPWVASNTDLTFPTTFGLGPGHGVQVRMLQDFSGVTPTVAGKPERALLDETVRRVGGERPLMVGDRLDTDIEGGHNAGIDTLCVLTGVTGLADLAAAPPRRRPSFLAPRLDTLGFPQPVPVLHGGAAMLRGWTARVDGHGRLDVIGAGGEADWWRAAVTAAWLFLDAEGTPASVAHLRPPATDGGTVAP